MYLLYLDWIKSGMRRRYIDVAECYVLHHCITICMQFCGRYAKAVCVYVVGGGGVGVHSRISLWSVSLADVM